MGVLNAAAVDAAVLAAQRATESGQATPAAAVAAFTGVIKLMPSPLVYAKRADAYLKLKKPNAAETATRTLVAMQQGGLRNDEQSPPAREPVIAPT